MGVPLPLESLALSSEADRTGNEAVDSCGRAWVNLRFGKLGLCDTDN